MQDALTTFFSQFEPVPWLCYLFPVLALGILIRCAVSLLTFRPEPEVWAWLTTPDGAHIPVTHWESLIGRGAGCDVQLGYPTVSRTHAVLTRYDDGSWTISDAHSKSGVFVNGKQTALSALRFGDVITMGGINFTLIPLTKEQERIQAGTRTRAGHAVHGTTRQVLSLITNPVDVICRNIRTVRATMESGRPDILGCHLEGPFLALARKGAHDPECLKDPVPDIVDKMLEASGADPASGKLGCIRQITIAPELPHGISAIRQFAAAGVVPAVGHCDADYETAKAGFDAGAGIMTHMFNAMNGLHHREPGPIPAAVEDPRVTIELINDGFHVQDPMVSLSFRFAPHRTAFVTDAMAATDCPDGAYKLGALDVNVVGGHARLVSNGAIAGSTLLLEVAVRRAVCELGFSPVDAVEAATLTPAKAFGFDRPNPVTGAPIGLIAPGFAADFNLADPADWTVEQVWCAGRKLK